MHNLVTISVSNRSFTLSFSSKSIFIRGVTRRELISNNSFDATIITLFTRLRMVGCWHPLLTCQLFQYFNSRDFPGGSSTSCRRMYLSLNEKPDEVADLWDRTEKYKQFLIALHKYLSFYSAQKEKNNKKLINAHKAIVIF